MPEKRYSWLAIERAIASRVLVDPRDLPFLRLIAGLSIGFVPIGLFVLSLASVPVWLPFVYLPFMAYWMGPYILMIHCLGHRPTFRPRFRWLLTYAQWVIGPFFGQSPFTFISHHMGMHHPENNLDADQSSTLRFRRDSSLDFARYFLRFLFAGFFDLAGYLRSKRRSRLLGRATLGESCHLAALLAALMWHPAGATFVLLLPLLISRFAMMAGNWAQHAFVDPARPDDVYRNSITCIETPYNERCFNDGYHIGHHLVPSRHWTEMRSEFEAGKSDYVARGAVVFQGLDYFQIWALLMLKRMDILARHCALPEALGGTPLVESELRRRIRPVQQEPPSRVRFSRSGVKLARSSNGSVRSA